MMEESSADLKDVDISVRRIFSENMIKVSTGMFIIARDIEQLRRNGVISDDDPRGLVHINRDKIIGDMASQLSEHNTCEVAQNHKDFGVDLHTRLYVIKPEQFTRIALDIQELINQRVDQKWKKKFKEFKGESIIRISRDKEDVKVFYRGVEFMIQGNDIEDFARDLLKFKPKRK
jgi:hypothetical protein